MACVHTNLITMSERHSGSQIAPQKKQKNLPNLLPESDASQLQHACKHLHTEDIAKQLVKQRDKRTDRQAKTNAKIQAMWEFSGGGVTNTALTPLKSLLSLSKT